MSAERKGSGSRFWSGFFWGGLAGAAMGLLLAPGPGQQLRERLLEATEGWRSRAGSVVGEGVTGDTSTLRDTIDEVREILREVWAEAKEVLREAVAEGREASARTSEEMRRRYEESIGHEGPPEGQPS